jgi:DNA-binding protein Alba
MPPKFQVYKDASGKFRFRLQIDDGEIIAVGEAYEQHSSCLNGIKSIQKNCNSEIEDLTIEGEPKLSNPKYQIFKDASSEFRFHLKAANGEIIAESGSCSTKEDCLRTIDVIKNSCKAEIEDLTASPIQEEGAAKPEVTGALKPKNSILPEKAKTVFVGNKMPMDYVMAIMTGLSASDQKAIILKARGKAITTAVDAAEITRNRFLKNVAVSSIKIGTEAMPPREGETKTRMVSTIEIVLTKE